MRRSGPFVLCLLLAALPARAEPTVLLLDLPFKVRAMRGPQSEAAVSVATSGLLPVVRAKPDRRAAEPDAAGKSAGEEESAPIAVVWGEEGGAVLGLEGGSVVVRPIGREAVEGLTAAETPRGALPGSRRALAGPLSAYLTGRARAPDGGPAAAVLTVRERASVAISAEPKAVVVSTFTVPAGGETVFAALRPRVLRLAGRPAFLAATLAGPDSGGLALVARPPGDPDAPWTVGARTPPQAGPPLKIAAIADFAGAGAPQAATVSARGLLQLWTLAPGTIAPAGAAAGFLAGEGDVDLAAVVPGETAEIALPVADGSALALVAVKGALRERLRVPLPAPAATGVVALGEGAAARLLVGLSDGRVAVVAADGGGP